MCIFQTEYARFENGRYVFRIHRSPLCEYMINFIHKLKHLPEKYMMNSVLENFTILQVNAEQWALGMSYILWFKDRNNLTFKKKIFLTFLLWFLQLETKDPETAWLG